MKKIVIVLGKSLLIEGIFSYLSTHLYQAEVYALDASEANALERIKGLQPDIVILESEYLWNVPGFPLMSLLNLFPHLMILELRPDSPEVNIIQTEQRKPANIAEMVSLLNIESKLSNPIIYQAV